MKRMKKSYFLAILFFFLIYGAPIVGLSDQRKTEIESLSDFLALPLERNEVGYMRLGDASNVIFRIFDKIVLLDPGYLPDDELDVINSKGLDLVIYTHAHGDHYNSDTAISLFNGSQPFIGVPSSLSRLLGFDIPSDKLISTASGKSFSVNDITVDVIEGEHIGPILLYKLNIHGITLFHGGDSAYVPLRTMTSDVAFVPTGSPSPTCSPKFAFQMISDLKPQIAIPMHGTDGEHKEFKELVNEEMPGTKVIISMPYETHKVTIN